jgi:hypothetical protein
MKKTPAFWFTAPSTAIIISVTLLVGMLALVNLAKLWLKWPGESVDNTLFIAILIVSLLPVVFSIIQVLMDKGVTLAYGDFKLDFSFAQQKAIPEFTMPINIGVPGQAVCDSMTTSILEALKDAMQQTIVIIDLEDGQAWWETRLLVLLHGAVRLGRPEKIVFVAQQAGKSKVFLGWAYPNELYPLLLESNQLYKRAHYVAGAVANQWNLVEPVFPFPPQQVVMPHPFNWMQPATIGKLYWAFDNQTGFPNELFEEIVMQDDLGRSVEQSQGGKEITIARLHQLFGAVLNKLSMDQKQGQEIQLKLFLNDESPFIAITSDGKYLSMVSRAAIYNEALKSILLSPSK